MLLPLLVPDQEHKAKLKKKKVKTAYTMILALIKTQQSQNSAWRMAPTAPGKAWVSQHTCEEQAAQITPEWHLPHNSEAQAEMSRVTAMRQCWWTVTMELFTQGEWTRGHWQTATDTPLPAHLPSLFHTQPQ